MFEKVKQVAAGIAGKVGDWSNHNLEKLKTSLDEMLEGSSSLQKVGYRLGDIELELALMPRAVVHLVKEFEAPDEAFLGTLHDHAGNKSFCVILKLLQQVNYVHGKVKLKNRQFRELEISLTFPPSVRMRYEEITPEGDDEAIQGS